jgi:hypothetical protein
MAGTCIITANVCVPGWLCEPGQTGYEIDGCGNRRTNPACNPSPAGTGTGAGTTLILGLLAAGVLGAVILNSKGNTTVVAPQRKL